MILASMAKLCLIDMILSYSPIVIISDPFLLSMFDLNGKMILVEWKISIMIMNMIMMLISEIIDY